MNTQECWGTYTYDKAIIIAENRNLANPMSVNSISCNAKHVITLEILADLQALSFRNADRLGRGTGKLYEIYTTIFHDSLVKFRKLLFPSQPFDDRSVYQGEAP